MNTLLLLLAACGGAARSSGPTLGDAVDRALVDAVAKHDIPAITGFLMAPVAYGGLWFADASCAQQFPVKTTIESAAIPAFASCLATLPFELSVHDGKTFLVYAPGIQVELKYRYDGARAFITGVGHATMPEEPDAAVVAISALPHPEGDKLVVPDDVDKVKIQQSSVEHLVGVFQTCFDGTGTVRHVSVLTPTGLVSYDRKVIHHLEAFKFQPVVVGAQALDVCTAIKFIYSQR